MSIERLMAISTRVLSRSERLMSLPSSGSLPPAFADVIRDPVERFSSLCEAALAEDERGVASEPEGEWREALSPATLPGAGAALPRRGAVSHVNEFPDSQRVAAAKQYGSSDRRRVVLGPSRTGEASGGVRPQVRTPPRPRAKLAVPERQDASMARLRSPVVEPEVTVVHVPLTATGQDHIDAVGDPQLPPWPAADPHFNGVQQSSDAAWRKTDSLPTNAASESSTVPGDVDASAQQTGEGVTARWAGGTSRLAQVLAANLASLPHLPLQAAEPVIPQYASKHSRSGGATAGAETDSAAAVLAPAPAAPFDLEEIMDEIEQRLRLEYARFYGTSGEA